MVISTAPVIPPPVTDGGGGGGGGGGSKAERQSSNAWSSAVGPAPEFEVVSNVYGIGAAEPTDVVSDGTMSTSRIWSMRVAASSYIPSRESSGR